MGRKTYSIEFKLSVVTYHASLAEGETDRLQAAATKFGVARASVIAWVAQHKRGELSLSNAISVSRTPSKVITGDVYHLAGKDFKSKDEAIRYAVELAGGLTVTKMTTIAVEV